jgi:hypothetical protein
MIKIVCVNEKKIRKNQADKPRKNKKAAGFAFQ